MWKREAEESVSEWCDSRKTVNSLILGFCIHVPLGLEGFSPISCSVSQEENRMVLMLWHPSASRKPGCTLSQHSLYCAFFISGDPGDGVPAHVEDLWDFRGPRCYVCTCKCVSEVFREICVADGSWGPGGGSFRALVGPCSLGLPKGQSPFWASHTDRLFGFKNISLT